MNQLFAFWGVIVEFALELIGGIFGEWLERAVRDAPWIGYAFYAILAVMLIAVVILAFTLKL